MGKIHHRTLQSLEYGKIIDYLASLCMSDIGRDAVLDIKPLENVEKAQEAFTLYQEAENWQASAAASQFTFSAFPDTRGLLEIVKKNSTLPEGSHKRRLDLDAFWALREMLLQARKAYESISNTDYNHLWPNLLALAQAEPLPQQLLAALNRCISNDGLLKDESSPELYRLRAQIRNLHQNCLRKVKDFANQYNMAPYLQDDFMTLSSDRYVLPLKANFKGRLQGIIHDWSQTGETCYFEPVFLVEVNNRLQELKHEEREEEQKILEYLGSLLTSELAGVLSAFNLLGALDVLNAKMRFAKLLNAACLTFTNEGEGIELLEARHPILALSRMDDSSKSLPPVRPLDIILRPGERALIITGGNAGGKTVCLKTLGLIAALAMSGIPVPVAHGSHLPWFDRIDAFIGDEQSLAENVSTFTAQIDHLAKAWKHLDDRGLILLDEFGAGTDPAEGAALAQAVLDELLEKRCFVLSATHFPALKSYALTKKGVRAASMLFNSVTNKPLFKLAYDQVGSSQALLVAAEHGLPEEILNRARHYLLQSGEDSSKLLQKLNDLATEREVEVEKLRHEQQKCRNQLHEKTEKLEKERKRLQDEARANIAELMHAWKEGKATAKQTMKEMSRLRANILPKSEETEKSILPKQENIAIGQTVFHAGFNKHGIVTDVDLRRQRARLDLNGVSLWANLSDIRQSGQQKKRETGGVSRLPRENATTTIDVRGMRAEEAIAAVSRFLDNAIPAGFTEVEIIHGRGTGALRREIHEYLHSFPALKSSALAPEDRGGDGMTIVELK